MRQVSVKQAAVAVVTPVPGPVLMRCGGRRCPPGTCGHDDERQLQRSAVGGRALTCVPPVVHEVLGSPGHALDARTGASMGERFGHDFSRVRVHTDERAAESARAVDAFAYTVGRDVVFAAGRYDPASAAGRRLLAHELTHVVQQSASVGRDPGGLTVGSLDGRSEHEAAAASSGHYMDALGESAEALGERPGGGCSGRGGAGPPPGRP